MPLCGIFTALLSWRAHVAQTLSLSLSVACAVWLFVTGLCEVRSHHLDFNSFLHRRFAGQRFVEVRGEPGCFVAFSYATCKEVMNDHLCFSSNPFPDDRLVALNTMAKADHSRVLRYVHKHYTQDEVQSIEDQIRKVVAMHTEELSAGQVDVVRWAKRIHMSSTLIRLGLDLASYGSNALDEVIELNDAMVALVAPLGGVGPKYASLPWHWWVWVLIGLVRSFLPVLSMALNLGIVDLVFFRPWACRRGSEL
ncbi:cyp144 [Symbiodinium natans]|uniref:Cyp144 protein n=1 Tax=Symbiodinium natans TaxID=878477 RepID=A0A812RA85_9DINO|nr:cyp144 [Symbiodinium natans]